VALGAVALLRENTLVLIVPLGLAWPAPHRPAIASAAWRCWPAWLPACSGDVAQPPCGRYAPAHHGERRRQFLDGNGAGANGQYRELVPGRGHPDTSGRMPADS
jgi:hypothetical protein